jgi:hypothetical protein
MVSNTTSDTLESWNCYNAAVNGSRPMNGVLSTSVNVPVGARITGIEFVITGAPQSGSVFFYRYTPLTTDSSVALYTAMTSGSGISVYASPALAEVFNGTQTFEAYYSVASAVSSSYCKGIRVRYVPPQSGFVSITPVRVYDSRFSMTPDANGVLQGGSNRTVSVANGRDVNTGALNNTTAVPTNATSIAYTLTVANTAGGGFLAVNPGGVTAVSASTINWSSANQTIANTGVVRLGGSRQVTVVHGGGGGADFIIDIVGYYI